MTRRTNRRQFIKEGAALAAGFWVAGGLTAADPKSPLEKLNFACIGVGGKGGSDTDNVGSLGNIVGLCDIDDNTLNSKAGKYTKAKKFNDFRKMLEELKDIDAVTVSTPDHTHAVAAVMAMKMGKHVYCQKPLTYSVYEARMMRETAAKMKVCTQMGNQGTALDGLRSGVELIQAGIIGPVKEFHVWTNRPVWPQAPEVMKRLEAEDPPKNVHWDLWIGPAPMRPYNGKKWGNGHRTYHDFNWRGWWDFGTGALGDMACHTANMGFMALKLGAPTTVTAQCGDLNPETYPSWASVVWEFPARGELPPVKMFWYEGKKDGKKNLPPMDLFHGENPPGSGSLLVGEKGILYSPNDYGASFVLLPKKDFEGAKKPEKRLPRHENDGDNDLNQKKEWVEAIKAGKPEIALSNFGYAGVLTEAVLLGNVAIRLGKKFEWDPKELKVKGVAEADKYIKREYRQGWTL